MSPLPKGRTNNPHGRPKLGAARRGRIVAYVKPATEERLRAIAAQEAKSVGEVVDELVEMLGRKRIKKRPTMD